VAPGIWKTVIGNPEEYDLLKAAGVKPEMESTARLGKAEFPLDVKDIAAGISEGKTSLRFPLVKEEQLYGFGLNFKTVQQRGRIMQLHVDHYGGKDNGRTHSPVPFYVSDRGYGVFINSARYITVYAGTAVRKDSPNAPEPKDRNTDKSWSAQPYSDAVEILVPAAGVEVYLFAGPSMLDVVRRFNLFNGGGCLPPRWGLGFTQRVPMKYNADDVIAEARLFAEKGYPLDFIGLEPGWQSKSYPCTLEWDKSRFSDPEKFVKTMKDMRIRLNLWTNPYISPESPVYQKIKPLTGSHTVWGGVVPDLTLPEARQIILDQVDKSQVGIGTSGYKIDECDGFDSWLWPDVATFPSGKSAEQMRQTYGLLLQDMTTNLYRQKNIRTYGLTRASNAGGSSFPYVLYNDYYSHEDFITALINSSFSGVLWTPEVRNSATAEEWIRRIQTVCFSPMAMINAWADGTKPWSFPEVEKDVKEITLLRMQLMPYFYSEFAKYHFEGTPPFRSMNLEPGFNTKVTTELQNNNLGENPYALAVTKEIKDQYMAGEYLLIAPLFKGQTEREVVLPKGKWYDFFTGKLAGDGEVIKVNAGLGRIPVFVKDGGIIPMMPPLLHAPAAGEKFDLEIRYYGSKPGTYLLYDDDGETFDYEKGIFSWRKIVVTPDKKGKPAGKISEALKGKPDNIGKISWKVMTEPSDAKIVCNPVDISYRYMTDDPSRRESADPTMVYFRDTYFLFASKVGGYWWSDDLVNWNLVETNQIPVEDYAPTVVAIGDTLFFLASNTTRCNIYKSTDPKKGSWKIARDSFPITMTDPALFLDDDKRLYFYWGCSNKNPLYAVELDINNNFEPKGKPVETIMGNQGNNGWENPGDYNELTSKSPWIEGSWMNKIGSGYFLQYACPGTEFMSYSDGVYVSDNPLGPFKLQKHNPFSYKPGGFICGAGHGSTFTDRYGNLWHIATTVISVNHMFERRLGLFPVFQDKDGIVYTWTGYGDYPFLIPEKKITRPSDLSTGWSLLSYNKKITASSALALCSPELACDENIKTFWSAGTETPGEWLESDMGKEYTVNALQINFAESGSKVKGRTVDCYYQYKVEYSQDNTNWNTLTDKTFIKQDFSHDFIMPETPVKARFIRLTCTHVPSGYFAVSDLRVFGSGNGSKPQDVKGFTAKRDNTDKRIVKLKWERGNDITGYNIRYGTAKDKLYQNYMIYSDNELIIRSLEANTRYFFTIEAFNENGTGKSGKVTEVK